MLTAHRANDSILVVGPGAELMDALLTPEAAARQIWTCRRVLSDIRKSLPDIREKRLLTGDWWRDWCRGEKNYKTNRNYALRGIRNMRREIAGLDRKAKELSARPMTTVGRLADGSAMLEAAE